MDIERELNALAASVSKAQKASDAYDDLVRAGGVSRQHVVSLESIKPGILTDLNLRGGFTDEVSFRHYSVALEQASGLKRLLFGAAFTAILYFFIRLAGNSGLFSSGGSTSSGGGSGGSYNANMGKLKAKHKKSEDELTKKTEEIAQAVPDTAGMVLKEALSDEVYNFLAKITDEPTIAKIRSDAQFARKYFLEFDSDSYSQFMRDVFLHEVNGRMMMIITSPNWDAFQKRAVLIATTINNNREKRVEKLKTICDDVDRYVKTLGEEVHTETFLFQGNESTYVEHANNDPDDIVKLRSLLNLPDSKSARDIVSDVHQLFVDWTRTASNPNDQHKFSSKKEFEERCGEHLIALFDVDQAYCQYMRDNAKTLIERLQESEARINELSRELFVSIRAARGHDEEENESPSPNTKLFQLKLIDAELDKARRFIHSYIIPTEKLMMAMGAVASLANMVRIIYQKGYEVNTQAVKIMTNIQTRLAAAAGKGEPL